MMATVRRVNLEGAAFVVALIIAWQVAKDTGAITSEFLASPTEIVNATGDLIDAGTLPADIWHTFYVTVLGWAIAAALGVAVGLALGLSMVVWRYSMASIEFLRALPAISFVPVAVLLLGFSIKTELLVVVYVSIWPIIVNTVYGARAVTPLHNDLSRMLRLGRRERIWRLVLPTAMPYLLVGLQFALTLSLALALVAEMIGNPVGMGHGLIAAQNSLQSAQMFAYVVLVGVLGVTLNAVFLLLARLLFPTAAAAMKTGGA
jgi:sulfonate transport system permease protein